MDDNVYKRQHIACINEQCGSSDALTEYKNGSAHCFACETSWSPAQYNKAREGGEDIVPTPRQSKPSKIVKPTGGEICAIESRCLKLPVVKKFNVRIVRDDQGNDIKHYYPYYN